MNKSDKSKINNFNFGNFLKELKFERDLTLKDISVRANLSYSSVTKLTSSDPRNPSLSMFLIIMSALDESVDELLENILEKPGYTKARKHLFKHLTDSEVAILNGIKELNSEQRLQLFKLISANIDFIKTKK